MSDVAVSRALEEPKTHRGPALLALPEDQWFERKSIRISARSLADVLVGMANAEGGTVIVGLGDGDVENIDKHIDKVNALLQASVDFSQPPVPARGRLVECLDKHGDEAHLLVVEVEASSMVHANSRDEVFLRIGDENRRLNFAQRQELIYDKGQSSFDGTAARGARRRDIDFDLVADYARALGHPDPERLLVARSLVSSRNEYTVACVLLFAGNPQAYFPEAYVRVLRYQGRQKASGARQNVVLDVRCEGPIPKLLDDANGLIETHQPARQALGPSGRFEIKSLIPRDAWLEGLVNAVVHRSYSLGGDHIRVEIFDDRIEIESPGRFPGLVDPDKPETVTRFARNPRIARVCADLRIGQELGEGIRRMYEEMRIAGLEPPLYSQTQASVRLVLSSNPLDLELESKLPTGSRRIVDAIRAAGALGTGDVASLFGLSKPAVLRRLRALQEAGLLEWVGKSAKDPRARWILRK